MGGYGEVSWFHLCKGMKGVDERTYERVLHFFGHIERLRYDMIAKKVYVGECGS